MAAARQKEMKVNITVVATNTFAAGRRMLVLDIARGVYFNGWNGQLLPNVSGKR